MRKIIAAICFVMAQAGVAPAATMTFDQLSSVSSDFTTKTYVENGIVATGNAPLFESFARSATSLYLANSGWGGSTAVTFSMGSVFNAISFDLNPSVFDYLIRNTKTGAVTQSSYANVRVAGFNDAGLAAELVFDMGTRMMSQTYLLGTAFSNLTSLVIGFEDPVLGKVGKNLVAQCSAPCSRYRLDNITLAPVPLPAGILLLVSALVGLGWMSRRRTHAA